MTIYARWISDGKECWQIVYGLPWPENAPLDYLNKYDGPMYTSMLNELPLHYADELYPSFIEKTHWDYGGAKGYNLRCVEVA